jgi:hypothetical protein
MNINPFLFNKTNKNRNIDGSFTREIDGESMLPQFKGYKENVPGLVK